MIFSTTGRVRASDRKQDTAGIFCGQVTQLTTYSHLENSEVCQQHDTALRARSRIGCVQGLTSGQMPKWESKRSHASIIAEFREIENHSTEMLTLRMN